MVYLQVAVPLPVQGHFTYRSVMPLDPGIPVVVPFGTRRINGWVVGTADPTEVERLVAEFGELKEVQQVLGDEPDFDGEQLRFFRWIADYYLSPLGEVIAAAVPSGATAHTRHIYKATDQGLDALATSPPQAELGVVLREVVSRPGLTRSGIEKRLHGEVEDVPRLLQALLSAGLIESEDVIDEAVRDEEVWVRLTGDPSQIVLSPRAQKARMVLAQLSEGPKLARELDRDGLKRLEKEGVIVREARSIFAPQPGAPPRPPPPLNAEQQTAVEAIQGGVAMGGTWLLHGVTGAGKTEVYLTLAEQALQRGQQILLLVPEISLTPQLTDRVAARFGERVAVLHSGLTGAERRKEWRRIREGAATLAVGARSAIFAPFARLGLIVVDEENDDSYKQDEGVRYNARDLAVVRGKMLGAAVVLGSATPSMESWENAHTGRYKLLRIRSRATPRPVPDVNIVDMRQEPRVPGGAILSRAVQEAVESALSQDGKAILLFNRRGYATFVECPGCGQAYDCPSCGVAMVYHQNAARLECHYCGFHRHFQPDCPKCGTLLTVLGKGTERVEEVVAAAFPGVPIGRMDADTTSKRGAHARILEAFRSGETRLLVGTQIVAKGHDFPDVHVAAVLGVDHLLGMPDFRSAERTFALVTQLCGRAGRGSVPGRVFLQTHHPEHPVFGCIGDMEKFASFEQRFRRMLSYPPYARLVLIRVEGEDRDTAQDAAADLARTLRDQARAYAGVDVLGPARPTLPRLVGRWRYQIIVRGRQFAPFRAFLEAHYQSWRTPTGIRRIVDVDPRNLW